MRVGCCVVLCIVVFGVLCLGVLCREVPEMQARQEQPICVCVCTLFTPHMCTLPHPPPPRVVYGDTDSLFVHLPGRSREDAFRIGQDIAATVTAANPSPVTLKMEKVYHPCVLLSKKRYVGAMYESPSQHTPTFDAKGIETIRRDTCPAVSKMLERCLRVLFATRDVSQVGGTRGWGGRDV